MYKLARILYELLEEWRRALEGNGLRIGKSITETIVNDFEIFKEVVEKLMRERYVIKMVDYIGSVL